MKNYLLSNPLRPKSNVILFIFRIGISLVMLSEHGIPKFMMLVGGDEIQFLDPIGIGVLASLILSTFAEFLCSILLVLGLFTRFAALALMINMSVALFIQHHGIPFAEISKQIDAVLLLSYLLLFVMGSGRISLDNILQRR